MFRTTALALILALSTAGAASSSPLTARAAKVPRATAGRVIAAAALAEAEERVALAEAQLAEAVFAASRARATVKAAKAQLRAAKANTVSAQRRSNAQAEVLDAYARCLSEVDAGTAREAAERCAGELE